MKMKKKSWHYRFLDWMNSHPSDNFCPYMRQLTGHLLLIPAFALGVSLALFLTLFPVYQFFWTPESEDGLWALRLVSLALDGGLLILLMRAYRDEWAVAVHWKARGVPKGMIDLDKWYHKQLIPKFFQGISVSMPHTECTDRALNIATEWARTWHDAICPKIEFVDDD